MQKIGACPNFLYYYTAIKYDYGDKLFTNNNRKSQSNELRLARSFALPQSALALKSPLNLEDIDIASGKLPYTTGR